MTTSVVLAILAVPFVLAITAGSVLLRRAFARPFILPEEIALAAAWVFAVGSLFWLGVSWTGSTFLGFGEPWTWLAAAHFLFAGFGALTITSLTCRVVSRQWAKMVLRLLLVVHPITYLVTAAGILGHRYCNEMGAVGYEMIFITQLGAAILGRPDRMRRAPLLLLILALIVPVVTLVPALAWAWGRPFLDLPGMVRYHGIANAIGHVGLGFVAFSLGRPPSHSIVQKGAQ